MRNSGIIAGTAFASSLLIGIVSGSTMPMLIIRPLIFAALFFAFSTFGKILVSRFLPELLEDSSLGEGSFKPGSRINILEDDSQPYMPEASGDFSSVDSSQSSAGAMPDESDDDLGDISELSEKSPVYAAAGGAIPGMDQNAKEVYTDVRGSGDSAKPDFSNMFGAESPLEASASGQERAAGANVGAKTEGVFNSDENLPDLDSMAGAFMSEPSNEGSEASGYSVSASLKKSSSKKAPEWTGDFNAKEIAMGLRTVLKKEKEG
jgi:hypothetical protein